MDAFKHLADLQGGKKPDELIEAHKNLGKKKFPEIETFDKSDVISHLEGQKIVANTLSHEISADFQPIFAETEIKTEPDLVKVKSVPMEENLLPDAEINPVWEEETNNLLQAETNHMIESMTDQALELVNNAKKMSDYLDNLSGNFREDLIRAGANVNQMPQISQKEANLLELSKVDFEINIFDAPPNQLIEIHKEITESKQLTETVQDMMKLEQENSARSATQAVEIEEASIAEEAGMLFL